MSEKRRKNNEKRKSFFFSVKNFIGGLICWNLFFVFLISLLAKQKLHLKIFNFPKKKQMIYNDIRQTNRYTTRKTKRVDQKIKIKRNIKQFHFRIYYESYYINQTSFNLIIFKHKFLLKIFLFSFLFCLYIWIESHHKNYIIIF